MTAAHTTNIAHNYGYYYYHHYYYTTTITTNDTTITAPIITFAIYSTGGPHMTKLKRNIRVVIMIFIIETLLARELFNKVSLFLFHGNEFKC